MTDVDLALMGPLTVGNAEGIGPRDRIVLSALALHPGEVVSADRIADALWRIEPPDTWVKVVQGCVVRLRRLLGASAIETTRRGYRLLPSAVQLDTAAFEKLIQEGREHIALDTPERAASSFTRALELWRGTPFEDLEDWPPAKLEAERLLEMRLTVEEDLLEARLESGEHRETAAAGLVLVSQQPLRERRWALMALAQYRCGRQADALASIRRAKRVLVTELGIDVGTDISQLEAAILTQDPRLVAEPAARSADQTCPYKGLVGYDVADADSFFGREDDTEVCLEKLTVCRILVLVGPSGSGKSSLLRAGLVPALRARGLESALFSPGFAPMASMATARAAATSDALLLIDQFEEVFTHGDDRDAAREWMDELARCAAEQQQVIITIRADHLAGIASSPGFARLAEQGMHLVSPLDRDSLRAAIEGPAARAGLRLEHGLVDLLVRDTEGEPGALPLLSYALAETWEHRDGRVLTVDGYLATGGIRVAVARAADQLYEALPTEQREVLRSVLLRLVTSAEDGEPVRSRVSRTVLSSDSARAGIVDLLVRARLVIAEEATVELAHEALARAWPRLRSWLDEDAAGLRILRHLSTAAESWQAMGRPDSELYQGVRLDAALQWESGEAAGLTALEVEFLEASKVRATSERQRERQRAQRQAQQNGRLRALVAGLASVLLLSALAAGFAVDQGREARRQRDVASSAQLAAEHVALVNQSIALRASNRSAAALLAVEAYRQEPDALARSALFGTFTASPGFLGYRYLRDSFYGGVMVPHSTKSVISQEGQLRLVDTETGALSGHFPPPPADLGGPYVLLKVSPDGRYLGEAYYTPHEPCESVEAFSVHNARACSRFVIFDLATQQRVLGPIRPPFQIGDLSFNDDSTLLALAGGYDGDVAVYRESDGRLLGTRAGLPRPQGANLIQDTGAVAFDHRGNLYLGSMAGPIRELDPRTLAVRRTWNTPPMSGHNYAGVTADGTLIASGDEAMLSIDTNTGRLNWTTDVTDGVNSEPCPFLGVAEGAGHIYCGSFTGRIREFSLRSGQATGRYLDPQLGSVGQLAFSQNGDEMVAFGAQAPVVARWRLDGSGPVTRMIAPGNLSVGGFDSSGHLLMASTSTGATGIRRISVWVAHDGSAPQELPDAVGAQWLGNGLVALRKPDETTEVFDVNGVSSLGNTPAIPGRSVVFPSADGTRFYVVRRMSGAGPDGPFTYTIRGYDSASLAAIGSAIHVRADVTPQAVASAEGVADVYVQRWFNGVNMVAFDAETGARLGQRGDDARVVQVSSGGTLVGGGYSGKIGQFDPSTLSPIGDFPGAQATVLTLQFSADGQMMLATSADQLVELYDVGTRIRLGDAIAESVPFVNNQFANLVGAWLAPDGKTLAVNQSNGVALWDLDAESLLRAACSFAGRNLTPSEWKTYLGDRAAYHKTCPIFGGPPA